MNKPKQDPSAGETAATDEPECLDAMSVLRLAVEQEKAMLDTDAELLEALQATILRVDAPGDACETAAATVAKLAVTRAKERAGDA